jgi:hypothetical protein
MKRAFSLSTAFLFVIFFSSDTEASILSAYVGLDDGAPPAVQGCNGNMAGLDGMPIVFSKPFDPDVVLSVGNFKILDTSGEEREAVCATLAPANDPNENRTILLIGDLADRGQEGIGSIEVISDANGAELLHADNSPATGDRISGDDIRQLGERGTNLLFSEVFDVDGFNPGCPANTTDVLWLTFEGGTNGGSTDTGNFEVVGRMATTPRGGEVVVGVLAVVDADNDNHLGLCVNLERRRGGRGNTISVDVESISIAAGSYVDPMNVPNPEATIEAASGLIVDGVFSN